MNRNNEPIDLQPNDSEMKPHYKKNWSLFYTSSYGEDFPSLSVSMR